MIILQKEIFDAAGMESLGGALARHCPEGTKLFLHGELGAGKTTLVRGFLRALGHHGIVKSPTYTLVEPYLLPGITVYHFDLYRLDDPDELETIGVRDYFDSAAICLVEWPEKATGLLGKPDLYLTIEHSPTGRRVSIQAQSPAGIAALEHLS